MNISQPHFIIHQTLDQKKSDTHKNFLETKGLVGKKRFTLTEKFIEDIIDIRKPKDYIICNRYFKGDQGFLDMNYLIEQRYNSRNFSNIIFVDGNKIIHHIHMLNTKFYFLETFFKNLNDVIKDISFYHENFSIRRNFIETRFTSLSKPKILPITFPILFRNDIGLILGLKCEKKIVKKLVDFFHIGLIKTVSKSDGLFPASLLVSDVYSKEQELEYYEVTNKNPVLSENFSK